MINYSDYAKALYELAEEEKISDAVLEEVLFIKDMLDKNSEFTELLDSPALDISDRIAMVEDAFGKASEVTVNFIKLLTEMRQTACFSKCAEVYNNLYDEANGILRPVIVTAVDISDAQCKLICDKIAAKTGKKVIPVRKTDPSVIGGVVLRYDGIQLDGSAAAKLNDIKQQLSELVL